MFVIIQNECIALSKSLSSKSYDRRPLLLFGAILLVPALTALAGPVGSPAAILLAGGLAIIAALHWQRLRRAVLALLPHAVRAQLPRTDWAFLWDRPVAGAVRVRSA